jgi:hypothetical protein
VVLCTPGCTWALWSAGASFRFLTSCDRSTLCKLISSICSCLWVKVRVDTEYRASSPARKSFSPILATEM